METKCNLKCRRKLSLYKNAEHVGREGTSAKLCSIKSAEHDWCTRKDPITVIQQEIKCRGHDGNYDVDLLVSIFCTEEVLQ